MWREAYPVCSVVRGISACLLAVDLCAPVAVWGEQQGHDPEWFDCRQIRRDGTLLSVAELHGSGFENAYLNCWRQSCFGRETVTLEDGSTAQVVRHVYLPKGATHYVWGWSLWKDGADAPPEHKHRVVPFTRCITVTPDDELWIQDLAEARYEGGEVHADNRIRDYRADYFYAPTRLLGDWSAFTEIVFDKKSSGGRYLPAYFEDVTGDVVLKNGSMRATFEIPEHHTGAWRQFRVPLDDPGWILRGGARSIGDILVNVTGFLIRAEYANGVDTAAIRNVVLR